MLATARDGTASLEKAIDLLEAVAAAPNGATQVELASSLGLPRTTVYRLLATLVARGLVRRDPLRKVYCPGFRCFEMARQAYAMPDLVAAAAMEMRALRDLTGETTYLAARDGLEVISLERVDGAHSERSEATLGKHKPLHCTSQGKAILSALDEATRESLIRDITLRALTPLTITDRRRLNSEIRITAARGYSIDDEEIAMGVRCVGAPIVDARGKVRGALSVAGPAYRLTRERLDLLGPEVAEAARRVGAQLAVDQDAHPSDEAVSVLDGPWAFHGAFPRWSQSQQCLYWADALAPALRVLDPRADRQLARIASPVLGMALCNEELIVIHEAGWLAFDHAGAARTLPVPLQGRVLAICSGESGLLWLAVEESAGAIVVGSMSNTGRFEPCWRLNEPVNSLYWNQTDATLYVTAPASGSILLLAQGDSVRRFVSMPRGSGQPSGLTIDAQGGIWTALTNGWSVMRFSPDGSVDRVIGVPVPNPIDLALGGPDGSTLYVTSARQSVPIDALATAPLSGRLFAISTR
jgi:DNA-binding IclR family transcriptional regulator/sugar lactone lactonase YvrE